MPLCRERCGGVNPVLPTPRPLRIIPFAAIHGARASAVQFGDLRQNTPFFVQLGHAYRNEEK